MVQIIPARQRRPSTGEQLMGGLTGAVNAYQQMAQQQSQRQAIDKAIPEAAGLPPEYQKMAYESKLKGKMPEKPLTDLQKAQQRLAEERAKNLQQQNDFFNKLMGNQEQVESSQGIQQSQQGFDVNHPESWSQEELNKAAGFAKQQGQLGIIGNIAQNEIERRREIEKEERAIRTKKTELGLSRDNEILKETDSMRAIVPTEEASLELMKDSLLVGDQSFFSPNNIAEKTGLEWFRDAAGGQFKTGSKTFLINNVSKFGARPNQYIEQQMADALAKVGRSRAANMSSYEAIKFDSDVKKEFLKNSDTISESDYEPGTLGKNIQKNMKDFVEKRQNELYEKLKFIKNHEKEIDQTPQGKIPMIDPKGRLVYIPVDAVDEAKFKGAVDL